MLRSSQQASRFHPCVVLGCILTQSLPVLLPFYGLPSCCCCQASISSCADAGGFSSSGLVLLLANCQSCIKAPWSPSYVLLLFVLATTALCPLCHHRAASSLLFCPILRSRRAKYLLPQSCRLFSTLLLLITPCPIFLYYQLLKAVLVTTVLCLLCHHRAVSSLLFCPILHPRNISCTRHFFPPPRCLLFLPPLRCASSTPPVPFLHPLLCIYVLSCQQPGSLPPFLPLHLLLFCPFARYRLVFLNTLLLETIRRKGGACHI